jgi:uncharacterized protein (TIGR00369 family)
MPRHEGGGQTVSDFSLTPETLNDSMSTLFTSSVFRCLEVSPTHVLAEQKIDQNGLRPGGFVPGPVQFSLADLVLWYLTSAAINRVEPMALTSDLSIRFLRPGQGEMLYARADLDKAGRLMIVGTVKIWVDDREDKPISVAQGTYVLPQPA